MSGVAIITGASRGFGEALVGEFVRHGYDRIVGIARGGNAELDSMTREAGARLEWIHADLADIDSLSNVARSLFARIDPDEYNRVVLVNNAGVVEPIARLGSGEAHALVRSQAVNAVAPLVPADAFIERFGDAEGRRIIINITSGLAHRPMTGVAGYCVSKAGLDMLTRCIAEEQRDRPNPVEAIAITPGTVATDMQRSLRESDDSALPDRGTFVELYESGKLYTPRFSAERIVTYVHSPQFESGAVLHVRDLGGRTQ